MDGNKLQMMLFFLYFISVFPGTGFFAEGSVEVNEVFKVGDIREIEVAVPKEGFIGAPPTPEASLPGRRGFPKWDEDFCKRYVRITVLEQRKLKEGTRIVLLLDGIDPNGRVLTYQMVRGGPILPMHLYYAYLDVKHSGCKIVGYNDHILGYESPRERDSNDEPEQLIGNGVLDRGISHGLPFPLMMTCPPVFETDKSLKENSWLNKDNGVVYTDVTETMDGRRVCVSLLQKVYPSMEIKQENIKYYSDKDKTLNVEKTTDSIDVIVSAQETQIWKDPNDWLWDTMIHTDGKGNITMQCRKLIVN